MTDDQVAVLTILSVIGAMMFAGLGYDLYLTWRKTTPEQRHALLRLGVMTALAILIVQALIYIVALSGTDVTGPEFFGMCAIDGVVMIAIIALYVHETKRL